MKRVAALWFALAGCGGGEGESESEAEAEAESEGEATPEECALDACGGDPTGTWSVLTWCQGGFAYDGPCAGTACAWDDGVSGTLTLADGGLFEVDVVRAGDAVCTVPTACDPSLACGDVEVEPYVCAAGEDASSCECTQTVESTWQGSGSWATDGNSLTIGACPVDFCVDGDTLWLGYNRDCTGDAPMVARRR